MKRKSIQIFAFILAIVIFVTCPFSVYATEKWEGSLGLTIYYNLAEVKQYIKDTAGFWNYAVAQAGAILKGNDWKQFMDNYEKMDELLDGNVGLYKENENSSVKGVFLSKEFMTQLKALLDEYAKEHEPYYMANTLSLDDLQGNPNAGSKLMYDTAKNLIADSSSGVIAFGADYSNPTRMFFVDIGNDFKNISPVKYRSNSWVNIYNNETWNQVSYKAYFVELDSTDDAIQSASEFIEKAMYTYDYGLNINYPIGNAFTVYPIGTDAFIYSCLSATGMTKLVSNSRRRIRIFNTYGDFQNYTLGKRSVYYTSKYYEYVPEDITVSIDEMQKSIDDLQKIIDELLEKINDNTSENEIEELLKQILEALKNQQGSGSGSGGGDVTVNVDLRETNNWLSKIYSKVSQIFDKMDSVIEKAEQTALDKIQESLDEIIVQLKKIKGWTIADTIIDGVDAVADWADFIKDLFDDSGSGVATISSTMEGATNLLKTKFPFCIPWDVYALITFLAHEPVTPVFSLPIKLERLDIEEYIEVDMSQFKAVSDISRTLLTLIYCYGLLNLTMKIFPMTKEET